MLKPLTSTVEPIMTREVPMQSLCDSVVSPFVLCLSDPRAVAHNVINRFVFLVAQTTQWVLLWLIDCLYGTGSILSAWLWATTSNLSVSFFRYRVLSHDQLFSTASSSVSITNCPCSFLLLTFSVLSLPLASWSHWSLHRPISCPPSGKQHPFIASVLR